MRNRVVHDYRHIDLEIIWEIVQSDVPALLVELKRFFAERDEV